MPSDTDTIPVKDDEATNAAAAPEGASAPPIDEAAAWCDLVDQAEGIDLTQPTLPSDDEYVDRYGHVLLELDAEEERIKRQAERLLDRVQQRRLRFVARHLENVENATRRLLEKQQGKAKKAPKSIDLARCRVGFRQQPVRVEYGDPAAVRKFAETFEPAAAAYAIVTVPKEVVDKAVLKAAVDAYAAQHDGALPDGIELAGGNDKLYVAEPKVKE